MFPEWEGRGERFDLALDLSRYVLEGMAIRFMTEPDEGRAEQMINYLADKLRELKGA